jgi:hypothetical protein
MNVNACDTDKGPCACGAWHVMPASPVKAWCVDRPSGTLIVIGTRDDAEKRASVMKAAGKEELMLNGPYEYEIVEQPAIVPKEVTP